MTTQTHHTSRCSPLRARFRIAHEVKRRKNMITLFQRQHYSPLPPCQPAVGRVEDRPDKLTIFGCGYKKGVYASPWKMGRRCCPEIDVVLVPMCECSRILLWTQETHLPPNSNIINSRLDIYTTTYSVRNLLLSKIYRQQIASLSHTHTFN